MTKLILSCAAAFLLIAPAADAATTIIEPVGSHFPYQRWIDESAVPTPDVTIEVIEYEGETGCYDFAEACTAPSEDKVWMAATEDVGFYPRHAFMHEIGHNFDADVMSEWARERFDALYGLSGPWRGAPGEMTPSEWFAEAYAECSVKPYIAIPEWEDSYGVVVFGGQPIFFNRVAHNKTCRMLQNL
jgi:hypothetical protein